VIDAEQATVCRAPFACAWLWFEKRTPTVRLVANENYWDKRRGPHLREVVFRNDLPQVRALELVCTTEGEVDILTGVVRPPTQGGSSAPSMPGSSRSTLCAPSPG
jgi:hypothetical protein